jgi:serine phosphatase RsbU (regulator of sigma subunit)
MTATPPVRDERLRFLSEASSLLAESLDLDVTLERVTSLAVPTLCDWCVIHLVGESGIRAAAVSHVDGSLQDLLREAHERYPTDVNASGGVGAVIRTGETVRHHRVDVDVLASIARDHSHLETLRRLQFGDVVTIALTARGRRLGALSVGTTGDRRLLDPEIDTAGELAKRAAVAIDNARLHGELQAAHDTLAFQAALLQTQSEADMEGQVVVAPSGEMISFNRRFAEMWSLPDEVIARGSDDEALNVAFASVAEPEAFMARVREIYAGQRPSRDEIRLRDGRVFDRFGAPLVAGDAYLGYAWYFRDVTEQKRTERRLLEAGERFAAVARTLQQSLLPPALPELPGLEVAARYHPAGRGQEVGGDFYDVFRTGRNSWDVVVGDVCGKGARAAAITALVRYTLRAAAMQTRSPSRALAMLNAALLRHTTDEECDRLVTVVQARVQLRRDGVAVTVASAGHPIPLVRRASGAVERAGVPGTMLGVLPAPEVHDLEVALSVGDALVFVTDGVTEARHGNDQFGDERLEELLATTRSTAADDIAGAVARAALAFPDDEAADDIAVVVITRPDPSATACHG